MKAQIFKQGDTVFTYWDKKGFSCSPTADDKHTRKIEGTVMGISQVIERDTYNCSVTPLTGLGFYIAEQEQLQRSPEDKPEPKFYKVNGYWKGDKEEIKDVIFSVDIDIDAEHMKDETLTNGVPDSEVFHYGLDKHEIESMIEEGENNGIADFVITSYEPYFPSVIEVEDTPPKPTRPELYIAIGVELVTAINEGLTREEIEEVHSQEVCDIIYVPFNSEAEIQAYINGLNLIARDNSFAILMGNDLDKVSNLI